MIEVEITVECDQCHQRVMLDCTRFFSPALVGPHTAAKAHDCPEGWTRVDESTRVPMSHYRCTTCMNALDDEERPT